MKFFVNKFKNKFGDKNSPEGQCFIISAPRSGSTWLQTALNSHPDVFCTEQRLFGNFFELWPDNGESYSPRITLDKYVNLIAGHYRLDALSVSQEKFEFELTKSFLCSLMQIARNASGKKFIADKVTPYLNTASIVADSIARYFPEAKIVFLIRDGRDVLTSGVFDWMERSDRGRDRHRYFVEGAQGIEITRFFDNSDIETWCGYWSEALRVIRRLNCKTHVVRYESMKVNQGEELKKLFDFMNLNDCESLISRCIRNSSFEKMSKGRKAGEMVATAKVRKGVSGDWKNFFTETDAKEFIHHSGNTLIEWGYETDHGWITQLPKHLSLGRTSFD